MMCLESNMKITINQMAYKLQPWCNAMQCQLWSWLPFDLHKIDGTSSPGENSFKKITKYPKIKKTKR